MSKSLVVVRVAVARLVVVLVVLASGAWACGDDGADASGPASTNNATTSTNNATTSTNNTTTTPDAALDTSDDDVAQDVTPDVELDAPQDVAPDAPEDVEPDIAPDVEPDVAPDVAPDIAPDTDDAYSPIEDLTDDALKDALLELIDGQEELGYPLARDYMYGIRGGIDIVDGMLECVYTGRKVRPNGTRTPGGFNTEHSWPQSDGAEDEPAKGDLHHLFPCDADANNARASHPFGELDCDEPGGASCEWENGGSAQNDEGGIKFEVRMETRGDIARAHFYFSVRYALPIPDDEEAVLRVWHEQDPPSDRERDRNDDIENVQGNRNPFIDRPEFVEQIAQF